VNKYIISLFSTFLICASLYTTLANAEQSGPDNTVLQFFDASRNGDVVQMRELIAGSYYNRRKALLENNDSYPAFLVSHYQGTTTSIETSDIDQKNQVAVVTVKTLFPDQSINTSRLILKIDSSGAWKIVDEK